LGSSVCQFSPSVDTDHDTSPEVRSAAFNAWGAMISRLIAASPHRRTEEERTRLSEAYLRGLGGKTSPEVQAAIHKGTGG